MITYVVTDLFQSPAKVLVNTVNTVGVMGAGIAKDFKAIYPEMFRQYQYLCETGRLSVGQLWMYRTPHKTVLNFPTKKHWRNPSRPEYIEAGLEKFVSVYADMGITSISFPLLGCGNGELDWDRQVRPLMDRYLNPLPIDIFVHLHNRRDPFSPEHRNFEAVRRWLRSEPRSLGFTEVWDELLDSIRRDSSFLQTRSQAKFTALVRNNPERIELVNDVGESPAGELDKEALLDLWQHLRGTGFVLPESFPSGLENYVDYVIPLVTRLPFVRPLLIARRYSQLQKTIGLQLEPSFDHLNEPIFNPPKTLSRA